MMDPATAYFLKKYYPHVIKWWLVVYNPEVVRIWPSKAEAEEALRIEAEEEKRKALEPSKPDNPVSYLPDNSAGASAFNASTGSYSGLYGQRPLDAATQETLNAIIDVSSNQSIIDHLLASSADIITPPEQNEVIKEANAIYARLLREAEEDEAKKQAEIDAARMQYDVQQEVLYS